MPIRLFRFGKAQAKPVQRYASTGVYSCELAHATGEGHAYVLHFEPGGAIGPHPAGFHQVFLVVRGTGWVAGADGVRHDIEEECGVFIPLGENHSKGSILGMVAVMMQASQFELGNES